MLGDALANNSNIKLCYLSNQGINSGEAMHAFTQSISNNNNNVIHTLNLSGNPLSFVCIEWLCHLLRSPQCKIANLNIDETGLGNVGSVCILQALLHNTSITTLYLSSNGISDVGLGPLAGVLRVHPNLNTLWLRKNKIVSFPVEAAMLHNTKLEYLYLRGNDSIVFPPPNIVDEGGYDIFRYFVDLRASGGVRQEVIPVMLVGRGAAGKTTIVQRAIKKLQTTPNGMLVCLFLSCILFLCSFIGSFFICRIGVVFIF
jgi:Leucine-rich repeat (LRR) protein